MRQLQRSGLWDQVDIDAYGFVRAARSRPLADVPEWRASAPLPPGWNLTTEERDRWAATMPCFPDVFGLPDTKPPSFAFDNFYARQLVGGYRVGEIRIGLEQVRLPTRAWAIDVSGHFWPGAVIPDDVLTMDGVGARVLGKTYDASWSDGPPPCVHGVPCPAPPPGHTVLRVDASILSVHEMAVLVRRSPQGPLELRSAITVDLASVHGSAHFLPRAGAPPIPYVVDAVTGENLSTWEIWVCSERGCSGPV